MFQCMNCFPLSLIHFNYRPQWTFAMTLNPTGCVTLSKIHQIWALRLSQVRNSRLTSSSSTLSSAFSYHVTHPPTQLLFYLVKLGSFIMLILLQRNILLHVTVDLIKRSNTRWCWNVSKLILEGVYSIKRCQRTCKRKMRTIPSLDHWHQMLVTSEPWCIDHLVDFVESQWSCLQSRPPSSNKFYL